MKLKNGLSKNRLIMKILAYFVFTLPGYDAEF